MEDESRMGEADYCGRGRRTVSGMREQEEEVEEFFLV